MKAAYFEAFGGSDVVRYGDLPTPEPRTGEVRVRVKAAALNPIDVYIRAGMVQMPRPSRMITGTDLAGVVDAVGPGATRFRVGDRVWGSNQGLLGRQGTFAEFCCPHEDYLYPLPAGVDHAVAAAGALVGITAHLGLFMCAKLQAGEWVFVNGGTGGVGAAVVQMAKAAGARVVATVGSAEKARAATELGADVVLNYKSDDIPARIQSATDGAGVNVWYETQPPSDLDRTVESMAQRGRVVVMAGRSARPALPNGPFYVKGLSLFGFAMFNVSPADQRRCADDMNRWMAEGKLTAVVGKKLKFSDAQAAHKLQEENTLGKAGTLTGKIVAVPG
ncbi:MAG TPA: NADPH:quinone reductase [Fimbriiglobus sp.]